MQQQKNMKNCCGNDKSKKKLLFLWTRRVLPEFLKSFSTAAKKNINAIFSEIVVLLFLHVLPILTLIFQQIDHQERERVM